MAVAVSLGGATPNFDDLYSSIANLSRRLTVPSPREFNDPGSTLRLVDNSTVPPTTYDTYIRSFYGKDGDAEDYVLYYKDANNQEQAINQFNTGTGTWQVTAAANGLVLNGVTLATGDDLNIDVQNGIIRHDDGTTVTDVGVLKLDGASGLDVALINERISQFNLVIEALNKVLTVASGNVERGVDLRI